MNLSNYRTKSREKNFILNYKARPGNANHFNTSIFVTGKLQLLHLIQVNAALRHYLQTRKLILIATVLKTDSPSPIYKPCAHTVQIKPCKQNQNYYIVLSYLSVSSESGMLPPVSNIVKMGTLH
jgi:hypothetical protein